jgi:hypothetical protein
MIEINRKSYRKEIQKALHYEAAIKESLRVGRFNMSLLKGLTREYQSPELRHCLIVTFRHCLTCFHCLQADTFDHVIREANPFNNFFLFSLAF